MSCFKLPKAQLAADHGGRAKPGHKILLLDRGAVRLEYPGAWYTEATDDCFKLHDKKPPDDECVLAVSYHHWPAIGCKISVAALVRDTLAKDERSLRALEPICEQSHVDFVLAWGGGRFTDPTLNQEACTRCCLARKNESQALHTCDFWPPDLERCPIYGSLFWQVYSFGQWIADPRHGPRLS